MNLPTDFLLQTQSLLNEETQHFLSALEGDAALSIRLNRAKTASKPSLEPVAWCKSGFYLPVRPSFTFDPLFHAGCYYPQEASSMFVEQAIDSFVQGDVKVLDLCAAPGGKSTHLLSLLSKDSLLVSNEVIRSRANILSENTTKSGYDNTIVTSNDPAEIGKLGNYFDLILVDAPCSGEGMFRKDEAAIGEWSLANVHLCSNRQQRIVADVWNALKPGGILVYSTCTYNTQEDEDNVQWICNKLGAEAQRLNISSEWNITGAMKGDLPVYRFFPHKTRGEGFFLAVLKKDEDSEIIGNKHQRKDKAKQQKAPKLEDAYRHYLKNADNFNYILNENNWNAIAVRFEDDYRFLSQNLRIVSFGISIGELKGKDLVPAHSLAMSNHFNSDAFVCHDVDWQTAIAYLRKEALVLDASLPRSYILLSYKNIPLGFVKNIGNRANNLYPQEWRIRSSNIPQKVEGFL